ncbi:MAG: glycosyltransferase family 2 protein [Acidobacteriota bacterium]
MEFKLTVIIPIYNAEKFLYEAVESAVNQKEVTEVILIEDNSPGNALDICRDIEKRYRKVKLYQHPDKKNHGAAASRNLGVIKASTEWIAFLDADDMYFENRFKHIPELIKENRNADGFYDAIGVIFEDEKKKKEWNRGDMTTIRDFLSPDQLFFYILLGMGHFHLNGLTVKKELLIKAGLFDERLRLHQDTHLCGKIVATGILVRGRIDHPVGNRRVHSDNRYTGTEKKYIYTRINLYKYLWEWTCKQSTLKRKWKKKLLTHYLYFDALKDASIYEKKVYKYFYWMFSKIYRSFVLSLGFLTRKKF